MKIGISAVYYASGGSLTNLVQLLREWRISGALDTHRVVLFASPAAVDALRARLDAEVLDRIEIDAIGSRGRGLLARLWAEQILLPRRLRARGIDVVFCPANVIPYAASTPTVVTFQNAAPFCESVTWRSLRHFGWWFRFRLLGLFIRASAKRATRVIFISEWFRDRLAFPHDRSEVIHRGRVAAATRATPAEKTLLYVSHLNPYKNVLEVIEAFARVDAPEWRFIIAGRTNFPWYREAIVQRIARLGLDDRITLTGEIDNREVAVLLANASAFVFASTCENCPTALIEALSYGLPVACSNVGVMPEIAGDAAAYFDPNDVPSIRDALDRVLNDEALRQSLSEKALARAATFAPESEVARRTLEVLAQAAGSKRSAGFQPAGPSASCRPEGSGGLEARDPAGWKPALRLRESRMNESRMDESRMDERRMKVAIVSCVFPPEPAVSARTSADLAEAMRARGHDVTVICPFPSRPAGRVFDGFQRTWRRLTRENGVHVQRTWSTLSHASTLASRFLENVTFGITSALALRRLQPDVAYLNSWPLFATALAVRALRVPFVVSVQDVYPESLFVQRRRGARLIGAVLRRIDASIAKRAKAVIVLSRAFADIYEHDRGVDASRVHVIPNWIDDVQSDAAAGRAYRRARGIPDDAFVVAYGGNVGVAANVEQLIEAFRALDARFHLIVAGSGPRAEACRALARAIAPDRIHFEDPWPVEETAAVLSAADLLALPTLGTQSAVSVPSKLLTYLLLDKPVLAIAQRDSEVARVIEEANAGWTVDAQDVANAIRNAASSSIAHGGRAYALRTFTREACLPRIVELLE